MIESRGSGGDIVALNQNGLQATAGAVAGYSGSGGTAADHYHIGFTDRGKSHAIPSMFVLFH
jgi:hypothetical protein